MNIAQMIEVTDASGLRINRIFINVNSILDIQEPASNDGCIIEVSSGNKLYIKESYDAVIKLIATVNDKANNEVIGEK